MIDYEKLEKQRVKNLNKFYGAIVVAIMPLAFILSVILIEQKQLSIMAYCVTFFICFFVLAYILFFFLGNQSFEHNIKQKVLPDLLKDIIKDKGELYLKKNLLFNIDMDDSYGDYVDFFMLPEIKKLENYDIDGKDALITVLQDEFDAEIDNKRDELYEEYSVEFEKLENEQSELLKSKENTSEIKERLNQIEKQLTKMDEEDSPKIEAEVKKFTQETVENYIKELNEKLKECMEKQYQKDVEELQKLEDMDKLGKFSSDYNERKEELTENIKNYNEIKKSGDIIKIKEAKEEKLEDKEAQYDLKLSRELSHGKFFAKDTYYGTYTGSKFVIFDIKNMCILKIEDKIKDSLDNIFITSKDNSKTKYAKVISACSPCYDVENKLQNYSFKVYSKSKQDAESMINQEFIDLVNCLGEKYSYVFLNDSMYIIWSTPRNHLKLISLFKKIDDKKQTEKFTKDMQNILNIVEKVNNLTV